MIGSNAFRTLAYGGFAWVITVPAIAAEPTPSEPSGLQDIVVTAQKRAQRLQDVPVAVTALTSDALKVNRVMNVLDLTGLAPGVTVRASAGGSNIPSFTIRGSVSYGVVPGSDRQVSTYLDGVYLSAPRGATFDLPDIERIEVLRGPQGTLFGRNATAGAVSVTTRDPAGHIGAIGQLTVGNYAATRVHVGLDTPQFGPFSAYLSYVHDYKRGDIRNSAAGTTWNRTGSPDPLAAHIRQSPNYLGTRDNNAVFAALKLDLGDFVSTYKFDYTSEKGTPEGVAAIGISNGTDALSNFFRTLVATQPNPVLIDSSGKRPDVVNNGYTIGIDQTNIGHNLTSTYRVNDHVTLKNIFGYRTTKIFSAQAIDGVSSLILTAAAAPLLGYPASLVGSPYIGFGTAVLVRNKQYSDEFQANYNSKVLTLTAGALWFHAIDRAGTNHVASTLGFSVAPAGIPTMGSYSDTLNRATSIAAYGQAEVHIGSQVDLVGGVRVTHDDKSGRFIIQTPALQVTPTFSYKDTRPSYSVGVNYKPERDILLYGKYSTAFVSGGSIAGIAFDPETAKSWEAGIKSELFNRRLRANLALFTVTYRNQQLSQSAALVPGLPSYLGTLILGQGGSTRSRGFEFETQAVVTRGATLGGSLSYTKTIYRDVSPIILAAASGIYEPSLRPKWTGGVWGQYDTRPVVGTAFLTFRADANWQSAMLIDANPVRSYALAPNFERVPPYWLVNGRVALRNISLGRINAEAAIWAKNITQSREEQYGLYLNGVIAAASFVPARTFGADITVRY